MASFTGVKVFSTTLARDREVMGETVSRWVAEHPELEVVEREVIQSSDRRFHCVSIVVFYRERTSALTSAAPGGGTEERACPRTSSAPRSGAGEGERS